MTFLRAVLWAGLLGSAAACQNNTIQLEDDATDDTGPPDTSGATVVDDGVDDGRPTTGVVTMTTGASVDTGVVPGVIEDGSWLLVVDTTVSPGLPFQFLAQIVQVSPGSYSLALQSLALDVGTTTSPRTPVGDIHSYGGLALGDGQPLQLFTGPILIPGAANPITGSDTTVDIYLDGTQTGDPFCGVVSGAVTSPIMADLAGSTFATVRLQATDPASLPVDFPSGC